MDSWETTEMLKKELGPSYNISCIGLAGENKVRYAMIISDGHSMFSRTGMGAVMGSKNLKAIAVKGTRLLGVADRKSFLNIVNKVKADLLSKPAVIEGWRTLGFMQALDAYSKTGFINQKNFQEAFETMPDYYPLDQYLSYFRGGYFACMSCPIGCKGWIKIKEGDQKGLSIKVSAPGTQVLIFGGFRVDSFNEIFRCVELANKYGLDAVSLVGSVGLAVEMFERGLINTGDTDGLELRWDSETMQKLIPKIAEREGFGDFIAEGVKRMSEKIGRGTKDFAIHVKGLEMGIDVRGRVCAENYGQATNIRGSHVERSTSITFYPGRSKESIMRYCKGIGAPSDRIDLLSNGPENFNVARLTKWVEDYNTMMFSMGLCHRTPLAQAYNLGIFSEILAAATGVELGQESLRECGERVWNLQKSFNIQEGATRKDDLFSPRILDAPLMLNGKLGSFAEERGNDLLDEYYDEREWNVVKGAVTRQKLRKLGLDDIASKLYEMNLID
jgi:aldehyde:ferredoxin oxidoreductase